MPHEVFISYSSQDKAVADAVCASIEAAGVRCWVAPRDISPGRNWGEAIIDAINNGRVMIVIFSSSANSSAQVMREVERAVNKGLSVLPFRIENVAPSESMEYFLSATHWLDALTPGLDEHIRVLVRTVQSLLGAAPAPEPAGAVYPQPQPAAPEPGKKSSSATVAIGIVLAIVLLIVLAGMIRSCRRARQPLRGRPAQMEQREDRRRPSQNNERRPERRPARFRKK